MREGTRICVYAQHPSPQKHQERRNLSHSISREKPKVRVIYQKGYLERQRKRRSPGTPRSYNPSGEMKVDVIYCGYVSASAMLREKSSLVL